jgi:hypothetical protein
LISFLGLVARPGNLSFSDTIKIEAATDTIFLGAVGEEGLVYFLPRDTTDTEFCSAINQLDGHLAPTNELLAALYELWLTTKKAKMAEQDREAMLAIYAKRMAAHDIDHVRIVLSEWSLNEAFFPSWAELQEKLDEISGWRRDMRNALRRAADRLTRETNLNRSTP